jgi:hypothetical protein
MNNQIDGWEKNSQDNIFEPFPKPKIFPEGWDLSAITDSVKILDEKKEQEENQMLD